MAGCAVLRDASVLTAQREPRFSRVIERRRVERPQVDLGALVLGVTPGAFPRDVPMHALPGAHAVGNRPVAGQASVRGNLAVLCMATLALACAFQR